MVEQEKQGWDKRAWLVSILGGVGGGIVSAWADTPLLARRINAAAHHAGTADWISGVVGVVSLLVLPGVVSGIARRKTFLWGLVPVTLFLFAVGMENWIGNGWRGYADAKFWCVILFIGGGCLLVSSGPVSLFRYGRVRARRRREAAFAALEAQREAASVPQEGVWPPPPDYRK